MKMLQQKHEIERLRKELELKQLILEQQCETEDAKLEESVRDHAVAEDLSHTSQILTDGYRPEKEATSVQQNSTSGYAQQNLGTTAGDGFSTSGAARGQFRAASDQNIQNYEKFSGVNIHQPASTATKISQMNGECEHIRYGKNTNTVQSGVSELTLSSIDTAFQQLASILQEGLNFPKPELLTFN
ncbi:hypothetical protein DPMN_178457 [Dreissena polymorpha]|uniref:Uncharacterized protein n=1 Tax=Dreissena polymorpha TaxID=45954 RepID=A0A9D4ILF3_DREPO|nr:hypothetical protein DPMN_178457 [Dreissena polymorpha]